jgi:tetratricopeptide (TPR) repeat protein
VKVWLETAGCGFPHDSDILRRCASDSEGTLKFPAALLDIIAQDVPVKGIQIQGRSKEGGDGVVSRHFSKLKAITAVLAVTIPAVWGQAAAEKKVKDQAEFDLFTAVNKEADPNKKVQLLNTWKEKYPDSDFKEDRQFVYIQTYQQLNQGDNMIKAAQDWLAMNPKATPPLYWITLLTPNMGNTSPERLDLGEKAARGLLGNLGTDMADEKKPPNISAADWAKQRNGLTSVAHKTLGWVEWQRKNYEKAEQEFMEFLKINPNSGFISYWLGTVMAAQKKPEKQVPALYHFARAGQYGGEDALPPDARKKVAEFFERNYANYHGSKDGMKEILDMAAKNPFPPADLKIESAQEIAIRQENELKEKNPQLALWMGVKKELAGPEGLNYFNSSLKDAAIPIKLKGKVLSATPAARPKEVILALATADSPEVKLVFEAPMTKIDPGTEIEFENAVAKTFTPDPFLLTLEVEKDKVYGWPAPARPAAGGAKKGGGAAKK